MDDHLVLPWAMLVEVRKELSELQRQRQQVVALKTTALGAALFLILANSDTLNLGLLALPATAAVFFDIDASGMSVKIKEIGQYIRDVLEPQLKQHETWQSADPLWEEYITGSESAPYLNLIGSSGTTILAAVAGIVGLVVESPTAVAVAGTIGLVLLNLYGFFLAAGRWRVGT